MATWRPRIVKALWRRASWLDRAATIVMALFVAVRAAELLGWHPASGVFSGAAGVVSLLFFVSVIFLLIRSRHWISGRLLWKLRNRLIFAYIYIAVVPVVLLLAIGLILGYLADVEVAAHLLHDDVGYRMEQAAAVSHEALSLARVVAKPTANLESFEQLPAIQVLEHSAQNDLPELTIQFLPATPTTVTPHSATGPGEFLERNGKLWIEAATVGQLADSRWIEARARVPVTSHFLDGLSPELGPLTLAGVQAASGRFYSSMDEPPGTQAAAPISTRNRVLPPAQGWYDPRIVGATTFDVLAFPTDGTKPVSGPLVATFSMRTSSISKRISGSLGEFEWVYVVLLALVAGLALILWLLAFVAGMVLTRTITQTVARIDEATHHVKAGDFSHRIPIARRDQLAALAESFNSMTASIESLLEEQRKKERLENELAIAREVQTELFPRSLPAMPGLELGAVCQAARVVSGDYYDCLELDSHRVAIALADISGKGISAALLMASLNAALRSLVVSDGTGGVNTAALAERLNRHLLLNTSEDRYATFFFAVYDAAARMLHYTNAGHLPPFLIVGDRVEKLDRGGPVIGLLDNCRYEQVSITVEPGSLLVAYSDGITEPENAYGEEFGAERLEAEILRNRHVRPEQLCNLLIDTVKEWCAPAEPFDDQTVVAARMG